MSYLLLCLELLLLPAPVLLWSVCCVSLRSVSWFSCLNRLKSIVHPESEAIQALASECRGIALPVLCGGDPDMYIHKVDCIMSVMTSDNMDLVALPGQSFCLVQNTSYLSVMHSNLD